MPGYRPPSTAEPRGKWAKRIHEKRRAELISQTGAFELLGPRLGLSPKSRSAYIALDMGTRQPTEAEAAVLAEWLGGYPDDIADPVVTPSDFAALISQMAEQNRLIGELVAQNAELIARLVPPEDPTDGRADRDLDAAEGEAAQERPQTKSPRRRSGPGRRGAGERRGAPQEETA